ncbi:MAG: TolC family protein [candidate division NC10 bacterium]|nr:TolC family protein [candidate division NC10 bacterium]
MATYIVSGLCFLLLLLAPVSAAAQGKPPGEGKGKLVISLQDAIKRTLAVSNRIKESRAGVDASLSLKGQADAARWAQIDANLFGGPSTKNELRSDTGIIDSKTTTSDIKVNGVFGRAVIRVVQPLYTFNKIGSFREAASRGVRVSQAAVGQQASEVVLQVKQAYYGALLASDTRAFLKGLLKDVRDSLKTTERRVEAGSAAATLGDVYQLRSFAARIEKGIADAGEGHTIAMDGLRTLMQLEPGVQFKLVDRNLTAAAVALRRVEDYEQTADEIRPEFVQLREGIKAREALVEAAVADRYPIIFAAALADVAGATNRDRSRVPIITDPLMHTQGGFFLGLNWHFDFGITEGRIDEARAEHMQLIYKKDFADLGIPFQVRKAYEEFQTATANIKNTKDAYRNARRWLVTAVANLDLGIGEVVQLTQAFILYIEFRVENFRAIHAQRIALANLDFATGEAVRSFTVQ